MSVKTLRKTVMTTILDSLQETSNLREIQETTSQLLAAMITGIVETIAIQRTIVTAVTADSDNPMTDILEVEAMLQALPAQILLQIEDTVKSHNTMEIKGEDADEIVTEALADYHATDLAKKVSRGEITPEEALDRMGELAQQHARGELDTSVLGTH